MRIRTGGLAALSVSMSIVTATANATTQDLLGEIVVQIHDTSGQSKADRTAALRRASELLAVTETRMAWRVCGQTDDQGRDYCSATPGSWVLVVRIMRAPRSARMASTAALGHALIDARSGTGLLATIYSDRVARKAAQAKISEADLLGRVIAHELGHLLLGQVEHGIDGLMRADWTKEELRVNRARDWTFTAEEAAVIRRRTQ